MKRLALLALLAACGPSVGKPGEITPNLPGEDPVGKLGLPNPNAEEKKPVAKAEPKAKAEPDPWAGRKDLITAPERKAPSPVNLPGIESFKLANGLEVIVVENHGLPVVSMHLAVNGGTGDEDRDRRGLGDLLSLMLTKGTAKRSADQLASTVDAVGASLSANVDYEATHVLCDALTQHVGTCFDVLPDVVLAPSFPDKELGPVKQQVSAAVKQRRDSAEALAGEHFENLLWGEDHPRGWPVTLATVDAVSRKDLVAWHQARFRPGNAILVIAGDVTLADAKARVEKAFSGWKAGAAPAAKTYAEPTISGRQIRVVDKPDQTQSQILVGHLGIAHGDADFLPTVLANYTLGGGAFSSRLMKVVRSEGGKTYGARSGFDVYRTRGSFLASTLTRTPETLVTLNLVLGEITRMKKSGPTAAELADAQSNVAGSYPLRFESAAAVAGAVLRARLHGLPDAWVRDYPVNVAKVTLAEAKAAAAKHFDPNNIAIVIVGKADEVAPMLQKSGLEFEVVDWLAPVSKRDRDAAEQAKKAPPDPKKMAEGAKLLDAVATARGGKAKILGIKSVTTSGKMKIFAAGGRVVEGALSKVWQAPDRQRLDMELPGRGVASLVLTPKSAWLEVRQKAGGPAGQVQDVPGDALDAIATLLYVEPEHVLQAGYEAGATVEAFGTQNVDGVDYDGLRIRNPDGQRIDVLVDRKTRLPFRVYYEVDGQTLFDEYGDYRDVNGVKVAFFVKTINLLLQAPVELRHDKVELNGAVPPGAFDKPAAN